MRELFCHTTTDRRDSCNIDPDGETALREPSVLTVTQKREPVTYSKVFSHPNTNPLSKEQEKEALSLAKMYLSGLQKGFEVLSTRSSFNPLHQDNDDLRVPLEAYGKKLDNLSEVLFSDKEAHQLQKNIILSSLFYAES